MQTTPGTPLTGSAPDADKPTSPEAGHGRDRRRHRPELRLWLAVVLAVYVVDQLTKWWAERALSDGEPRDIVDGLVRLHLAHNAGAAFSTGTSYTVVLTVIAMTVIAICLRMAGRLRSRGWAIALGLVVGGALGNVTDRLFRDPSPFRGHVVDFVEFPHWPIFNVADSAISVAAVLFVWLAYRGVRIDGTRG
jgi:signal peptidase II